MRAAVIASFALEAFAMAVVLVVVASLVYRAVRAIKAETQRAKR